MSSVICAVRGCHNNWKKKNLTLSQQCFEHGTKRSECCGPLFTLHRPPSKEEDLRTWISALNLKKPPKRPFVCSYHFVDGKPTPEHPFPEKWLGHGAPLKRQRRVVLKQTPASSSGVEKGEPAPPAAPAAPADSSSLHPDHAYAASTGPSPLQPPPITCHQWTQCSGPSELHRQLLRSDHLSLLYTGLPLNAFHFLADQLTKDYTNAFQLDARDQVFMTLMKLRLNLLQDDLAERFHVSHSQVGKITSAWFDIMEEKMRSYVPWLPRDTIQATMPQCFKEHYPTATCVIDCSETPLQNPRGLDSRGDRSVIKYLVAMAPRGLIMFVSAAYGGRYSDTFITEYSGFLEYLGPGDVVMADRGFLIADLLRERNVSLVLLPELTKKGLQQSKEDTRGSVRIHVERVLRRLQHFRIISQTVPINLAHKFDKILRICAALSNLRGNVHEEDDKL